MLYTDHPTTPAEPLALGWHQIAAHRAYLVAYARRRLLDPALAEDLVHDVFEAVMTGRARFGGRSALRSWLVAILKHRIVDLIRERSNQFSLDAFGSGRGGSSDESEHDGAACFECPQPLPDEVAEVRQRLRATLVRIAALPETLRRVVELRVLQDLGTEEVCSALAISEENLFVRMHRARRQLMA